MLRKTSFTIVPTPAPITTPITKFGGQPVWLHSPHWPIDPATGELMLFQSQIVLDPALFPNSNGAMAYIFFGDGEQLPNDAFAVVLQTKDQKALHTQSQAMEFANASIGPTIYEWITINDREEKIPKEYQVILDPLVEEEAIPLKERYDEYHDLDYDLGYRFSKPALAGNKIGGQPFYVGYLDTPPEYFTSDEWLLLLQLAPTEGFWDNYQPNFYPFYMEMGEFSLLNVFMTKDFKRAEAYIQMP